VVILGHVRWLPASSARCRKSPTPCALANSRQLPGPRAPGSSNLDTKARGPLHVRRAYTPDAYRPTSPNPGMPINVEPCDRDAFGNPRSGTCRTRPQGGTQFHRLIPRHLIHSGRRPHDRIRGLVDPVITQALRERPVRGRGPSGCRAASGFGRGRLGRTAGDQQRGGDDSRGGPPRHPICRDSRAERCGTRPPSASTRSSTYARSPPSTMP